MNKHRFRTTFPLRRERWEILKESILYVLRDEFWYFYLANRVREEVFVEERRKDRLQKWMYNVARKQSWVRTLTRYICLKTRRDFILFYVLDHTGTLFQIPDMYFKRDTTQRIVSEKLRNYLVMRNKLFAEYIMLAK